MRSPLTAERTNEKVAHLGDACHPAVLRQIRTVLQAAHNEGILVGLCGEARRRGLGLRLG